MNSINLANERWLYWRRSPTPGLRFVRLSAWSGDTIPHSKSLRNREVLGYGLNTDGRCSRVITVITNGVDNDGCFDWSPCASYRDTPVDPASLRVRVMGDAPRLEFSSDAVAEAERHHRRELFEYWSACDANEAATIKARAEQLAKAEAEQAAIAAATAAREAFRIVVPPPKPQKTLWQRIFGGA